MKIFNTTPKVLKHQIEESIAKAVSDYREDYPNDTGFTRKCVLNMETMVNLLLSMQGGSLKKELYDAGIDVTASAFVQQRNKLLWTVFEDAFENFNANCNDVKKYKGYRVLAIDGTTVNMARNPKSDSFVQNDSNPKGYNQLHVNPLYDVLNKTYQHCIIQPQPKMDEVGCLAFYLSWYDFKEKTLIVADRGYESYNTFAHFLEHPNVDFLICVKQEIFSTMLMMNFCNRIVNEIVIKQKQENIYEYKVNMKMAMYLCRQFFRVKNADEKKLIKDIAKYLEPVRPDRRDTRNVKANSFVGFVYRVST